MSHMPTFFRLDALTRRAALVLAAGAFAASLMSYSGNALAQRKTGPAEVAVDELMKPGDLPEIVLGPADAKVTVVEYGSMTCGHCANFATKVFPDFKTKYIDSNKVRFIFREFPLDNLAAAASMLARCAGGDKTLPMIETLYAKQPDWAFTNGNPVPKLFDIAKQAGFTQESFDKCLTDQKLLDQINATRARASDVFGVSATPVPDRTLREFRQSTQGLMTREQQLLVVDQAEKLLDLFYVHRPLKEAMHAVRPIQRLRVIRRRLEEEPAGWTGKDELRLHNLLTEVFISVRDLHTNYLLPQPYRDYTAFLPFLVRPYYDADGQRRYMVTQVTQGIRFADDQFRPGVEVLSWNGVAIETAVDLSAQQTAGSNLSARFVRGVDALTLRPLNVALPPEADWVHVGFRTSSGDEHLMRQDWLVRFTPPADAGVASGSASLENLASLGIDIAADAVREVKQLIFTPETVFAASARARTRSAEANPLANEDVPSHLPLVFEARRFAVDAREWAYIRIRTFAVFDPDAFVQEFMRLAALLPPDGLILDVRGNGGGHIFAAERLLQVLTPNRIEPERLQFISTPGTLALCRRNQSGAINLSPWVGSLQQAVLTGATYSQALPITDPESCNAIGQRYHGPVVLLIDGRCYSATDIFAAGFQDHGIGLVVGTSANTGAGGANVWGHDLLQALYAGEGSPLQPLPLKMGMRVAIRQTLRVGARAGTLLEDFGVSPRADLLHRTTERDLLEHDADLIEFAARQLAQQPVFRIGLRETGRADGLVQLQAECQEISRLDVYLSGHPRDSIAVAPGATPPFSITPGTRVELRGFAVDAQIGQERCVAALKELIT